MNLTDIAATAAALAATAPPEGWRVATDAEGRDYLYNNQGEVRWAVEHLPPRTRQRRCASTTLRRALDATLNSSSPAKKPRSSMASSETRSALPRCIKRRRGRTLSNRFVKRLPVLVERSRNVAGADARRARRRRGGARPLPRRSEDCDAAFSSEIDPSTAFSKADHGRNCPLNTARSYRGLPTGIIRSPRRSVDG